MRVGEWGRGRWGRVSRCWMDRGMAKLWVKVTACEGRIEKHSIGNPGGGSVGLAHDHSP